MLLQRLNLLLLQLLHKESLIVGGEFGEGGIAGIHGHASAGAHRSRGRSRQHRVHHPRRRITAGERIHLKTLLQLFDVLLQHHHIVGVFLRRHVDAQVTCHVGLVVAHVASPRRFWLSLYGEGEFEKEKKEKFPLRVKA